MVANKLIVLDAPSNLGLNPPADGVIPGCYKLPWSLRDRNLLQLLDATDGGCVVPPRYVSKWEPGDGDRNAEAIAYYAEQLADRLGSIHKMRQKVLVLGGDCSVLIGSMLALKRIGRYGLVFLDAHSDFRHPGNSECIGAAAGEDLAIVTGRGDQRLVNIDLLGPYVCEEDIHIVGVRPFDDFLKELTSTDISVTTSKELLNCEANIAEEVMKTVTDNTGGFWIHFDCDVVDKTEMPAVDCPESEGPSFSSVAKLLKPLLASPECVGMEVTIFDPDLDPAGIHANRLTTCLLQAFSKDQQTNSAI